MTPLRRYRFYLTLPEHLRLWFLLAGVSRGEPQLQPSVAKSLRAHGAILALVLLGVAANSLAAELVTNTDDSGTGSLRQAILNVNADGGGDIDASQVTGTITLLSPLPSFAANITVTGPGTNALTVSGNNQVGIFSMNAGTTNTLSGVTIANGSKTNVVAYTLTYGAGISNAGSLTLVGCAVLNCRAFNGGGGAIYNTGNLVVRGSRIANCSVGMAQYTARGEGGALYNLGNARLEDSGITGCFAFRAGGIENYSALFMINCVIDSCYAMAGAEGDGGGILNAGDLTMYCCRVSNGSGFWGGGISSGGTLMATNSAFLDNSAMDAGGGLCLGGASNVMSGCTVSGNHGGSAAISILNSSTHLLNCTISGNYGRAVVNAPYYSGSPVLFLDHCTIASNLGFYGSGGGVRNGGVLHCQNSIIAGNFSSDFSGVMLSEGHNLVQNTNGCTFQGDVTGNLLGVAPLLGPLQDNGGPTWTHALLPGSPAIDAGTAADGLGMDQRGIPRPQGLASDIGAFEFQYTVPVLAHMALASRTNCWVQACGLRGGSYTLQASGNLTSWVNVATLTGDTTGVCEFTEPGAGRSPRRFYRLALPVPAGAVYLPAPSGIMTAPFVVTDSYIGQPTHSGLADGGRVEYPFGLPTTGCYTLQTTVNAADASTNSLFVNIDAEPQDPSMIWDVFPYTTGFEPRTVTWRGSGTDINNEFVPLVFPLSQGPHKLIIRGREASTLLRDMALVPYPAVYLPASSGAVAFPFIITNNCIYQMSETILVGDGGRAAYNFTITNTGNYVIRAVVDAPDNGANSFFLNIDAEPVAPTMIWDVSPLTSGFEQRLVSWRGSGTDTANQYVPQVFHLSAGSHQLIVRGREAYTQLQGLIVLPYP